LLKKALDKVAYVWYATIVESLLLSGGKNREWKMKITIEQILSYKPCGEYDTEGKIISRTGEQWPKTHEEIAALDIPAEDRIWVLLKVCTCTQRVQLGCDFAERVLHLFETKYPNDSRPSNAIQAAKRGYSNTTAYAAYAADAAAYAADAAAYAAAFAAGAAAYVAYAAYAAADTAAYAAGAAYAAAFADDVTYTAAAYAADAANAEREWQLQRIVAIFNKE
jgi:hypothetical protein